MTRLQENNPVIFLRLLHTVLVDSHADFYSIVISKGYDLFAKKDVPFMQGVCRLLQREFNIRPGLTPDQFFTPGFLEAKISLVMACCNLVKAHLPQKKSTYHRKPKQEHDQSSEVRKDPKFASDDYDEMEDARVMPQLTAKPILTRAYQDKEEANSLTYQDYQPEDFSLKGQLKQQGTPRNVQENVLEWQSSNLRRPFAEETTPKTHSNLSSKSSDPVDHKDTIIASQRQFIQELKNLVMATNDNLRTLTDRFAHFGNEVSSKIESLEARIKLLEAVVVIKRDSVFPEADQDDD